MAQSFEAKAHSKRTGGLQPFSVQLSLMLTNGGWLPTMIEATSTAITASTGRPTLPTALVPTGTYMTSGHQGSDLAHVFLVPHGSLPV